MEPTTSNRGPQPRPPARGTYAALVDDMNRRYPNLKSLSYSLCIDDPRIHDRERGRVAVVEFSPEGCRAQQLDLTSLRTYLHDRETHPPPPSQSTLILLEDLGASFIEILGKALRIEPRVFAQHLRASNWTWSEKRSEAPTLPSQSHLDRIFTLRYPELIVFDDLHAFLEQHGFPAVYCDTNGYRKFSFPGTSQNIHSNVGLICKKITYWASPDSGTSSPIGLILVDPPVQDKVVLGRFDNRGPTTVNIKLAKNRYYQSGYIDFLPWQWPNDPLNNDDDWNQAKAFPKRESLFDDMIHYCQTVYEQQVNDGQRTGEEESRRENNSGSSNDLNGLTSSKSVVRKISVSHWIVLSQYVQTKVSTMESDIEKSQHIRSKGDPTSNCERPDWVEQNLDVIYRWKRHCEQYSDWLDMDLLQLGIMNPDSASATDIEGEAQDWIYVLKRFQAWSLRVQDINNAALNLISITDSARSLRVSQDANRLTVLGSVFLPLSLVASLFSMSGNVRPGQAHFWIYFAISVPCAIVTLAFCYSFLPLARFVRGISEKLRMSKSSSPGGRRDASDIRRPGVEKATTDVEDLKHRSVVRKVEDSV